MPLTKTKKYYTVLGILLTVPFILIFFIYYQLSLSGKIAGRDIDIQSTNINNVNIIPTIFSTSISNTQNLSTFEYIVITETPTPTPTRKPTPTPKPTLITSDELDRLFSLYSDEFKVEKELLKRIAYCESKMNPFAENKQYAGLFQFSENSWESTRRNMGLNPDPQLRFNSEESIRTAAFKIANGGLGSWPNCNK